MRFIQITLLLILSFCFSLEGQISFRQASYNQCKKTAVSSQLPFVVYVTARWCLNCKLMEETTFRSQGLQIAVDGKYNTYKIDFDSHQAQEWKNKFGIRSVPAFLIFDSNGEMIQRVDKALTSTKIIELLNNPYGFYQPNITNTPTNYTHNYAAGPYKNDFFNWNEASKKLGSNSAPVALTQKVIQKPIEETTQKTVVVIEEIKEDKVKPKDNFYTIEEQKLSFYLTPSDVKVVEEFTSGQIKISEKTKSSNQRERPKPALTSRPTMSERMEEMAKVFYKVSSLYYSSLAEKSNKNKEEFGEKLYRIQFGIFADINDTVGLVEELRRQQPHPIFTLHESRGGKSIYRVVVGKFSTYESANQVKDEIYIKGLQAMVIEI